MTDATTTLTCAGRLKGYRRIFSRFEKLDLTFLGFISFVLVEDELRMC
jgi:hypothetical protein